MANENIFNYEIGSVREGSIYYVSTFKLLHDLY